MVTKEITDFYQQTSLYTDLGYYKDFVRNLPDDINELCLLQRKQIIHPIAFSELNIRDCRDCFWGDMTEVPVTRPDYEDDLLPTALSMIAELLRRNPKYSQERAAKDKIHITCRGQAIMLVATLKAKGYAARARSGFAPYIPRSGGYCDHWVTEYYSPDKARWILVDADMHCPDEELNFDLNDMPHDKFIFGAEAYLGVRNGKYHDEEIVYSSNSPMTGIAGSLRGLFYDFHALMNDEIMFFHLPKYICDKNFKISEEELTELDRLATLMLEPDKNFNKLLNVWQQDAKYRIMSGGMND